MTWESFQLRWIGYLLSFSGCQAKFQTPVRGPDGLSVLCVIDLIVVIELLIELDRKIGEIPYKTGSRFTPDKGCLTGTRTAFLDFIVDWVNDPASERSLVLFGQSGTGKSSSLRLLLAISPTAILRLKPRLEGP